MTGQIDNGTNYHIIIDNADIEIPTPPEGEKEETGGWSVDLDDWNNVSVPLN